MSDREYAEAVDEVVVYPVLRAAREMLTQAGEDASHLEWVPDGIWEMPANGSRAKGVPRRPAACSDPYSK